MYTVYKVVRERNDSFVSFSTDLGKHITEYKIGEEISAGTGLLFCTRTIDAAEALFASSLPYPGNIFILECTTNYIPIEVDWVSWYSSDIDRYWDGEDVITARPPVGTVVVRTLTPVKVVV